MRCKRELVLVLLNQNSLSKGDAKKLQPDVGSLCRAAEHSRSLISPPFLPEPFQPSLQLKRPSKLLPCIFSVPIFCANDLIRNRHTAPSPQKSVTSSSSSDVSIASRTFGGGIVSSCPLSFTASPAVFRHRNLHRGAILALLILSVSRKVAALLSPRLPFREIFGWPVTSWA